MTSVFDKIITIINIKMKFTLVFAMLALTQAVSSQSLLSILQNQLLSPAVAPKNGTKNATKKAKKVEILLKIFFKS